MKPLNKSLLSPPKQYIGDLEAYRPKYNFIKAVCGVGLIAGCIVTLGTNFLIPFIVPVFLLQVPVNPSKFRQSFIGSKVINFKFKLLSMLEDD